MHDVWKVGDGPDVMAHLEDEIRSNKMACRVRRDYSDGLIENKAVLKDGKDYFIVEVSHRLSQAEFYPKHENHAPRIGPFSLKQAQAVLLTKYRDEL